MGTTPDGDQEVFGDGLYAGGSELHLSSTIVMDCARTGVFFDDSSGTVHSSLIVDNQSFGLALRNSTDEVQYDGQANLIYGNALGLPEDQRSDVTHAPEGLPSPTAPIPMEPPPVLP